MTHLATHQQMYRYTALERAKHSRSLSYSFEEFAPMFLLVWVTQTLCAYYLHILVVWAYKYAEEYGGIGIIG